MVSAGSVMPELPFTVKPVRVLCSSPKPETEPPPKFKVSVWLLPTAPPKLSTPLLVLSVRLLLTARVLSKLMLPPWLLIVDAPDTATGVTKVIGEFLAVRFTPTLVVPPAAFTVNALNADGAATKFTLPVPCASRLKVPVIFWLCVCVTPLTVIEPPPVVSRSSPPELLMRCSSVPVMVIGLVSVVPPKVMLPLALAIKVIKPVPEASVLLPSRSISAARIVSALFEAVRDTPSSRMNEPVPVLSASAVKLIGALSVRLCVSVMSSSAV